MKIEAKQTEPEITITLTASEATSLCAIVGSVNNAAAQKVVDSIFNNNYPAESALEFWYNLYSELDYVLGDNNIDIKQYLTLEETHGT